MKLLLLVVPMLLVTFAGCTTAPEFVTPPMEDGKYVIIMTAGLSFSPALAEVPANATILFKHSGSGPWHDVTSADGAFARSPQIEKGESWELTLSEPGDYDYFCTPHKASGMKGTIRVV